DVEGVRKERAALQDDPRVRGRAYRAPIALTRDRRSRQEPGLARHGVRSRGAARHLNAEEATMIDRIHVEKAAATGAGKLTLLLDDPLRYMLRSVGAGMGLTLVVFVFWVLKQNLQDTSFGAVIASAFFG